MKLYDTVNVDLSYQNFGTVYMGILRGQASDINLVFNGLYNYVATNGNLQFCEHTKTVATFWTSRNGLRRYFFNRYLFPRLPEKGEPAGKIIREAMRYALEQLKKLQSNHQETWQKNVASLPEIYQTGKIGAESPDYDMKDLIVQNAFAHKDL